MSKHFGSQFAPLQFSTTMLTSGWPSVASEAFDVAFHLFQSLVPASASRPDFFRPAAFCKSRRPRRCRARRQDTPANARASGRRGREPVRATCARAGRRTSRNKPPPARAARAVFPSSNSSWSPPALAGNAPWRGGVFLRSPRASGRNNDGRRVRARAATRVCPTRMRCSAACVS